MESRGEFVSINNELFYKISGFRQMDPFFISIVSNSNHWMYVSSNGGLTAGRKNPDLAIFPYYTDDKIHDAHCTTGSVTLFNIQLGGNTYTWKPFDTDNIGNYTLRHNLYKNTIGNKIIFEEINTNLNVAFQITWTNSEEFGIIRRCSLIPLSTDTLKIRGLDGVKNLLPYGVSRNLQNNLSTLVDAYKISEIHNDSGLGVYALNSMITDRAEPSEAHKANVVYSIGEGIKERYLSDKVVLDFMGDKPLTQQRFLSGQRGNYLMELEFSINNTSKEWLTVLDVEKSVPDVLRLNQELLMGAITEKRINSNILEGSKALSRNVSKCDGLLVTNDQAVNTRHFSNVLFNIMRGGVFGDNYQVNTADYLAYIKNWNRPVLKGESSFFQKLPAELPIFELLDGAKSTNNAEIIRLTQEYLPLTFSRRHGDPSRPWNWFDISIKDKQGKDVLDFQGNWRDIFQNWEALAFSFPEYLEPFITKFLNASTLDGFNPYRITKNGFDWELFDPEDPWSNIGYWGDHQIIYLLKLLELSEAYHPGTLTKQLNNKNYVFANVPYRIKYFQESIANPRNTVVFDETEQQIIAQRVEQMGNDGKLVFARDRKILKTTLFDKLLIPILSKLAAFVPDGGIWMNTQRPEWNDANNALVGSGLSMVTTYYLYRHLTFLKRLVSNSADESFELLAVSKQLFIELLKIFTAINAKSAISESDRYSFMEQLGLAFDAYKNTIYHDLQADKYSNIQKGEFINFLETVLETLQSTCMQNKKENGLFHSYNLLAYTNKAVAVTHLDDMLEGQVAVLSSGLLSPMQALNVLNALGASELYRPDQQSYTLYPNKNPVSFFKKNNVPVNLVNSNELLLKLIEDGNTEIIEKDSFGTYHFEGSIRNAEELSQQLNRLSGLGYDNLIAKHGDKLIAGFEELFNHHSFTGRSGSFFKYEGLGSIYWHMVSKLLLATQENIERAKALDPKACKGLKRHFNAIEFGIGFKKSPAEYGAFPMDPYSHTPAFTGVQQPGMTGQVKEDIITRFKSLGVVIHNGTIAFDASCIHQDSLLENAVEWKVLTVKQGEQAFYLPEKSLGFTICQTPIVYKQLGEGQGKENKLVVHFANGKERVFDTFILPKDISQEVFKRTGMVRSIEVVI